MPGGRPKGSKNKRRSSSGSPKKGKRKSPAQRRNSCYKKCDDAYEKAKARKSPSKRRSPNPALKKWNRFLKKKEAEDGISYKEAMQKYGKNGTSANHKKWLDYLGRRSSGRRSSGRRSSGRR